MVHGRFSALLIVTCMLCAAFVALPLGARAEQGETDAYGYRWTDSDSPTPSVSFEWVDITSSGTDTGVSGDDAAFGPYLIGFPFEFYGVEYTELYISTNGLVTFEGPDASPSYTPIPIYWGANGFVAPFWSNLYVDYGGYNTGTVFYETIGAPPNQQTVIEFYEVSHIDSYDLMTFEVILNETGEIWFNYLTLNGWVGDYASVGIENADGYMGTEYSFAAPNLHDGLAVMFSVAAVSIGPDGTTKSGAGTESYHVVYVANHQAIEDTFELTNITDNGWSVTIRDEASEIVTDTDGDLVPDTGVIPAGGSKVLYVGLSIPADPVFRSENITVTATSDADPMVGDGVFLTTEVYMAEFGWPFTEYANDTNSDGYYESLEITVPINVAFGGDYRMTGRLYQDGTLAFVTEWSTVLSLSAGSCVLVVPFDGYAIRSSALDGPYFVGLQLLDTDGGTVDMDGYITDAYLHTEFRHAPAEFVLPFAESASDSDGDTLYDTYDVDVTIQVNAPGAYDVWFYFDDPWGGDVWWDELFFYLDAGLQTLRFSVPGQLIYGTGVNGVFQVYTELYDEADTWSDYASQSTAYLYYSEFESVAATIAPPLAEDAVDSNSNGLYDYLAVEVTVDVTQASDFLVSGYLSDAYMNAMCYDSNSTYLDVGSQAVLLVFPGPFIGSWGVDGPYYIYVELHTGDLEWLDWADIYTDAYAYTDFDTVVAEFAPPHDDWGVDDEPDGLYDSLSVTVSVSVNVPLEYCVMADVYNWHGLYVCSVEAYADLGTGPQNITLTVDSGEISMDFADGPYGIDLYLYETVTWSLLDTDTYETSSYLYTDFELPDASFQAPHSAVAVGSGSGSGYEALVLSVNVSVVEAGEFTVRMWLHDYYWDYVAFVELTEDMTVGLQTVDMYVPGWKFPVVDADGPYQVELNLFGEGMTFLGYDYFQTPEYSAYEFDPELPTIVSGWTFSAPSVDGAVDPGEWADATAVDLLASDPTNELGTTLLVMHNMTHLFICFDATGDVSENDTDRASMTFDTGLQDFLTDGEEDQFEIDGGWFWGAPMHAVYDTTINDWAYDCWPFDDSRLDHEGLAGAMGFGGSDISASDHRIYEFAIPLALLEASLDDVIGFCTGGWGWLGVADGSEDMVSEWPTRWTIPELPEFYGSLSIPSLPVTTTAALEGTAGLGGWYVSGVEVSFSAVAMEPIDFTMYSTDGGTSWTEYSSPFTISEDGEHEIEFYSVDVGAREEEHKTVTVRVDISAPTSSGAPTGTMGLEDWYVSPVVVEMAGSDPAGGSGVSEIMYRVDGGDWEAVNGVSVTVALEGPHTLEYYAVDVAGNAEDVHNVTMKVDTVAPITTASVDGSVVNLTAADVSSGLWITLYRIDGGAWTAYTVPFEVTGSGNHTVEFYSSDVAGNNETLQTMAVENGDGAPVDVFGLPWYLWIALAAAVLAIAAVIAVPKVFGMRRKAKESDSRAAVKDIGTSVAQFADDVPSGSPDEEPPSPDDALDRLAEELDRK